MDKLSSVVLQPGKDKPIWALEKSGKYTTKSMYRFFTFRGELDKRMSKLWKSKLPLKLKIFMWLTLQGRIQTGVALKRKKWKGDANRTICNLPETVDHVLFRCVMARFVWMSFKEALGWERVPDGMMDLLEYWIPMGCADYDLKFFIFVVVTWAIWVTRNKIRMQRWFPHSPIVILYKINSFVQRWAALLQETEQGKLRSLRMNMKSWMKKLEEGRVPFTEEPWQL